MIFTASNKFGEMIKQREFKFGFGVFRFSFKKEKKTTRKIAGKIRKCEFSLGFYNLRDFREEI